MLEKIIAPYLGTLLCQPHPQCGAVQNPSLDGSSSSQGRERSFFSLTDVVDFGGVVMDVNQLAFHAGQQAGITNQHPRVLEAVGLACLGGIAGLATVMGGFSDQQWKTRAMAAMLLTTVPASTALGSLLFCPFKWD